MHKFSRNSE